MADFLDEAGIMNMLPRPNVTQMPTRAPTQAPTTSYPLSPQLTAAATLTRAPVPTTSTLIMPVATPGPITSTPAPYLGPQDDLIFDPDPLEGDAPAGAGYALPGSAMSTGQTSSSFVSTPTQTAVPTATAMTPSTVTPLTVIDLVDEKDESNANRGGGMSLWTWVAIIALLIAVAMLLFAIYGTPGAGGKGMRGDPFAAGLAGGGIASGLDGLGSLGGGRY
jgi:hypothetical protein